MKKISLCIVLLFITMACTQKNKTPNAALKVVTTTSQLTDLVSIIGGNVIELEGLMGAGVDPHLYKASEGDVATFFNADIIFYNGLHLEGKLEDIFEKMKRQGKKTIAVSNAIDKKELLASKDFASNYDPHFWFSIKAWEKAAQYISKELELTDPKNAEIYKKNTENYLKQLTELAAYNHKKIATIPIEKRILVTAHDAFAYFGKDYNFKVVSLQGLSTATEAGVQDVQRIAAVIMKHNVKAIFIESSVPVRTVKALQEAVKAKNHQVVIGGTLYSDALGNPNTAEGTYIGMYQYNVNTISNALIQ